tara:strand:+ start:712 stop:1203 length:492 start_codon:yes stop_codon:yes gene_type:complete
MNYLSKKKYDHSDLKKWRDALKFFDFTITWEDGDFFSLTLKYENKDELFLIMEKLGLELTHFPAGYQKIVPGKIYRNEPFPKAEIPDFPELMQPEYIKIEGVTMHCKIWNGSIYLTMTSKEESNWDLSESRFKKCLIIEEKISHKELTPFVSKARFCDNYTFN